MHEDLLRHIWARQLFDRSRLAVTDGRAVRIINPGTLHRGSGPDFRNAAVEIGATLFTGDIEFHRSTDDWTQHRHHNDPNYNSVILHVALNGNTGETHSHSGRVIPTIILEPFLLSPLESIRDQLAREEYLSIRRTIKCSDQNDAVDPAILRDWIRLLYRERLQEKTIRLYDRLCDIILRRRQLIGEPRPPYNQTLDPDDIPLPDASIDRELLRQKLPWEQLLYEQIMDGLGYSGNREPMKRLAESVPLVSLIAAAEETRREELSSHHIEAILFKASGLLPLLSDIADQESKVHIHSLNAAFAEVSSSVPLRPALRSDWIFSPTRPSNFPTIRIAAAGAIVQRMLSGSLFKSLIAVAGGKYSSVRSKIEQLQLLLEPGDHPFWNFHYTFTEPTHRKHAVLGESRKNDIIVNAVIPFVCLYAKVFGKNDLADYALTVAVEMPPLEENSILRTMEKHLIKKKMTVEYAYQQQGLIQLNKKYCTFVRCNECAVGREVFP